MTVVELRVELPAYSHSFIIQVPDSFTISDVKNEISISCPGQPRVLSQKLIWRGRRLEDSERLTDIWRTPDDPRVVHLAVHPSGWASAPPPLRQYTPSRPLPPSDIAPDSMRTESAFVSPFQLSPPFRTPPASPPNTPSPHPLAYVALLHENAIRALAGGINPVYARPKDETWRAAAIRVVERNGWMWSPIFDEIFPEPSAGGLIYERTVLDGKSYLSLKDRFQEPTPLQTHALKVLTYTFPLLAMSLEPAIDLNTIQASYVPIPPTVNELLQEAGMTQLRLRNMNNQERRAPLPALRDIPLQPILAPMLMLVFRTLLLLYFVAPARKPIFGVLILAWMLYEIWQPIRNGLLRGIRHAEEERRRQDEPPQPQQQQRPGEHGPMDGNQVPQEPRRGAPGAGGVVARNVEAQMMVVFDALANMNIKMEEEIISGAPEARITEPGLGHKAMTFLALLVATVHPAVWDRRRAILRRREGVIQMDARVRNASGPTHVEGEESVRAEERSVQLREEMRAQFMQRPRWVQRFMERVIAEDWVDDME